MSVPVGLIYQDDFISSEFEDFTIKWLDSETWSNTLKRRTQQFGYEYNYLNRNAAKPTIPLSGPILKLADYLHDKGIMNPQQCIVNEYTQIQGISHHTDSSNFGPVIVSISLLEPCNMKFTHSNKPEFTLLLNPRSVLILSGEARYEWQHEITVGKKTYIAQNGSIRNKLETYRRVSLTYRTK